MHSYSLVHDSPFYKENEIQAHVQKKKNISINLVFPDCFSSGFIYKNIREMTTCFLQEVTHSTKKRQQISWFLLLYLERFTSAEVKIF